LRRQEKREPAEQSRLDTLRGVDPELTEALDLATSFTAMVRKETARSLTDWLRQAERSTCVEIRKYAEGLRHDESAIAAALTDKWSNGAVEGHVNRLKTIKRQMYGRASLPLLRARVLHAA
jgi:transposase